MVNEVTVFLFRNRQGAYSILVGTEGKRQLGRPACRWEENIKMNCQEVGWGGGVRAVLIWPHRYGWRALVYEVTDLRVL